MKLQIVTWRDAHFELDAADVPAKDYLCRTVGWTKREGRFLRIEGEHTPDGPRAVTRVPIENVVKRKNLR